MQEKEAELAREQVVQAMGATSITISKMVKHPALPQDPLEPHSLQPCSSEVLTKTVPVQKRTATIGAYHVRAESLSKVVSSILETNVTSLLSIEALGKDADYTQVDEQADEQRQCRLYAEVCYGFLLPGHFGTVNVPAVR